MNKENSLPQYMPCVTCGVLKNLGNSKKNKPYYFCDECGVQVFIRGKEGISKLESIESNPELRRKVFSLGVTDSAPIIQKNSSLGVVKSQIKELESNILEVDLLDFKALGERKEKLKRLRSLKIELEEELDELLNIQ